MDDSKKLYDSLVFDNGVLREKLRVLREEVTQMRDAAEKRNRQLDALGIVWCDGGCPGGMRRYTEGDEIDADQVAFLIHNAMRARAWFVNRSGKGQDNYLELFRGANETVIQRLSLRHEEEVAHLKKQLQEKGARLDGVTEEREWSTLTRACLEMVLGWFDAAMGPEPDTTDKVRAGLDWARAVVARDQDAMDDARARWKDLL